MHEQFEYIQAHTHTHTHTHTHSHSGTHHWSIVQPAHVHHIAMVRPWLHLVGTHPVVDTVSLQADVKQQSCFSLGNREKGEEGWVNYTNTKEVRGGRPNISAVLSHGLYNRRRKLIHCNSVLHAHSTLIPSFSRHECLCPDWEPAIESHPWTRRHSPPHTCSHWQCYERNV